MSNRSPLVLMVAVFGILLLSTRTLQAAMAVHFDHVTIDSAAMADINITFQDDSWYSGQNALYDGVAIWLNPDPREGNTNKVSNIGRVVYKDPMIFSATTSFSTRFSFQIITTGPDENCGSGLAFFIQDSLKAPPHSMGRYLGLFNPSASTQTTSFFAVEFDTHQSLNLLDPSASHVGIDINNLITSVSYADSSPGAEFYPHLYLYNNDSFTAWVDYNSSSNLIQVWMEKSGTTPAPKRPFQPILKQIHNLSALFEDRPVYIGLSGSNNASEDGMQGNAIWSWSFTDEGTGLWHKSHGKPRKVLYIIAPIIFACSLFIMLAAIAVFRSNNIKVKCMGLWFGEQHGGRIRPDVNPGRLIQRQYTLQELKRATSNFSEEAEVGRGAFSIVFRGIQPDGSPIAVKKLNQGVRKEDEFASSMSILSTCRHKNILELQGWYYGKHEAMLVYKFMENSSLDEYLYGAKKDTHMLTSEVRLKILEEVSLALGYMHTDLDECVLHRDVKAANVLLADGFKAILGDFGLACLVNHNGELLTTKPAGTLGYIAPELLTEGRVTAKSDVYSFGVLIFEVAYGRRVIQKRLQPSDEPEDCLLQWVWKLKECGQHVEALDPRIGIDKLPPNEVRKWINVLHVAFLCCDRSPEERPTMKEVSQVLQGGKDPGLLLQPPPTNPPPNINHRTLQYVNSTSNAVYFSAMTTSSLLCGLQSSGYAPLEDQYSIDL